MTLKLIFCSDQRIELRLLEFCSKNEEKRFKIQENLVLFITRSFLGDGVSDDDQPAQPGTN